MQRLNPDEGEIWQHYKGDWYRIITIAEQESDGVPVVVYRSMRTSKAFSRPLSEFMEVLEGDVCRFKKIGYPPPTDLDHFVDLYSLFGIDCIVGIDTDNQDRVIILMPEASDPRLYGGEFAPTKSNKITGHIDVFCEYVFDKNGKFIRQGFHG